MQVDDEIRNATVDAAAAILNGGSAVFLEDATPLLTFALKAQAFNAAAAGAALLDTADPLMTATATGDAAVALNTCEFRTALGAVKATLTVGAVGSGAEITMNHPNVIQNDVVDFDNFELSMPAGE